MRWSPFLGSVWSVHVYSQVSVLPRPHPCQMHHRALVHHIAMSFEHDQALPSKTYNHLACRYPTLALYVHQGHFAGLSSSALACIRCATQEFGPLRSLSEVDARRKATETSATIEVFPCVRQHRAAGVDTGALAAFSYILWSLIISVSTFFPWYLLLVPSSGRVQSHRGFTYVLNLFLSCCVSWTSFRLCGA